MSTTPSRAGSPTCSHKVCRLTRARWSFSTQDRSGSRHGLSPSYNPSWWVGGISDHHYTELTSQADHDPLLNRAIQGSWAPGSTFKLATATAALNDGLLSSLGNYINDPGYYQIAPPCTGQCTYYDNTNNGQHEAGQGILNVQSALTVSDDVFFYTLGADYWYDSRTYGQIPIQTVAEKFGFGELTGIDLPNEYSGQVDSPQLRQVQHSEAPRASQRLLRRR